MGSLISPSQETSLEPTILESARSKTEHEPVTPTGHRGQAANSEYSPPPNGGSTAWLQVLGAWCYWFSAWGIILSYGVFQEYYQKTYLRNYSPSDISWIGTIQAFLVFFVGTISGPLFDRGYMKHLLIAGTVLETVGLMTASVATSYYAIFLSLGLCSGLGMGLLWLPSVSIVGTYFTTKRPLAGGLSATGAGVGNVVFSVAFRPLVNSVGFGWAVRVIAFICLAAMLLGFTLIKQRPSPNQPRHIVDWSAFLEAKFNYFCVVQFFVLAAAYVPFYYLALFAEEKVGMSESLGLDVLSAMGAGSVAGRFALGLVAVTYGVYPVLAVICLVTGLLIFIWGAVSSVGGVFAFGIFYGFLTGGLAGLQPIAVQYLAPMHLIGTRSGMVLIFDAIGVLVGNPIAGAILNSQARFAGVQAFAGAFMLFGTLLVFLTIREIRKEEKGQASSKSSEN